MIRDDGDESRARTKADGSTATIEAAGRSRESGGRRADRVDAVAVFDESRDFIR